MDSSGSGGGGGAGNASQGSSDFVRKLYKMLEDPSHRNIVRWSQTGDSFIVVDTNDFTKNILPQHFKHSNFASFVRQLNKYDFHKIKNTEDGGGAAGENWQFKHPEFTKDSKDNLENIRRKAPASRKQQLHVDDSGSLQIEQLQEGFRQLRDAQQGLGERMQKFHEQTVNGYQEMQMNLQSQAIYIQQHDEIIKRLLSVLSDLSVQLRTLRGLRNVPNQRSDEGVSPGEAGRINSSTPTSQQNSESPLLEAQRLMESFRNLQRPNIMAGIEPFHVNNIDISGTNFDGGYSRETHRINPGMVMNPALNGQVGSQFFPEMATYNHGQPSGQLSWQETPPPTGTQEGRVNSVVGQSGRPLASRKRSTPSNSPQWRQTPRVLLVEDDPTCRRIGSKFLSNAQCIVDVADDGLIAVNKMGRSSYDIVLMDIMMPNLDGCSAAALIRQFNTDTPIVAMTSNIRREDINNYFTNGMNDVLPKPFTKEGLLSMLEQQLRHLTRNHNSNKSGQHPVSSFLQNGNGSMVQYSNSQHAMQVDHNTQLAIQADPNSHHGMQSDNNISGSPIPNTNIMKYSGSTAPQRSPQITSEEPTAGAQSSVGLDDPGGFVGMMGPYMPVEHGNPNHRGYQSHSPASGTKRGVDDETYCAPKKQRY